MYLSFTHLLPVADGCSFQQIIFGRPRSVVFNVKEQSNDYSKRFQYKQNKTPKTIPVETPAAVVTTEA